MSTPERVIFKIPGQQGPVGLSIVDAVLDGSNHLIVTLSDDTEIDCGAMPAGPAGTSITGASVDGSYHLILTRSAGGPIDAGYVRGPIGATGAPGANGVSITGGSIDGSYHLILTLSSGGPIDAGNVRGPAGPAGTSITGAAVDGSSHLIITLSDTSTIDAGSVLVGGPVTSINNKTGVALTDPAYVSDVQPSFDFRLGDINGAPFSVYLTRGSTSYRRALNGLYAPVAANEPLIEFGSDNKALGTAFWDSKANSIRNNSMQGAVVGAPGTLPTNSSSALPVHSLTTEVIASGVQNGMEYMDLKVSGTASSTGTNTGLLFFETATQIAAAAAQIWTGSVHVSLVGGSLTGLNHVSVGLQENTSGGAFVALGATAMALTSTLTRASHTRTLTGGTTAAVQPAIFIGYTSGAVINATIRIGWPQCELGSIVSPPIRTTTVAVTRNADAFVVSGSEFSDIWNPVEGEIFVEFTCPPVNSTSQYVFQIDDGGGNNRFYVLITATNVVQVGIFSGGVSQGTTNIATLTPGTTYRLGLSFKQDNFIASLNGATVVTDTSALFPVVNALRLGHSTAAASRLNGTIKRFTYWPKAFTSVETQRISA